MRARLNHGGSQRWQIQPLKQSVGFLTDDQLLDYTCIVEGHKWVTGNFGSIECELAGNTIDMT